MESDMWDLETIKLINSPQHDAHCGERYRYQASLWYVGKVKGVSRASREPGEIERQYVAAWHIKQSLR
jgi:hypothetical protein